MNKSWFYLGVIGSLAVLTTSCGGDSGKPATPAASPAAVAPPTVPAAPTTPTAPTATTTAAAPKIPGATPPTVPGTAPATKPVSVDVAAGLIPPTNGDNWAKTVSKGRSDPFAALALQPIQITEKLPLDATGKPQGGSSIEGQARSSDIASNSSSIKSGANKPLPEIKTSGDSKKPKINWGTKRVVYLPGYEAPGTGGLRDYPLEIASVPRAGVNRELPKIKVALESDVVNRLSDIAQSGKNRSNPQGRKSGGDRPNKTVVLIPRTSTGSGLGQTVGNDRTVGTDRIATKPEPLAAKPLQAMALEISGVIEVAGKTQVIVKLPSESFSRYIEVGERVANGTVLVKRVEGQQSLSPTIVLEEVGVEVSRKIGDKSAPITP